MSNAKYIVVQMHPSGTPYALTFPPWETHDRMARRCIGQGSFKEFVPGAGEFKIYTDEEGDYQVDCFGKSTSLKIESRGKEDADILKYSLFGMR